jgi:UDP-glucose 4-epimerase
MNRSSPPTVAVTGAAGYIGSRVVHDLLHDHPTWSITAVDNFYEGDIRSIDRVSVENVDIRNRDRLNDALAGADIVLHLAAISGVEACSNHPELAYEVNVQGTNNVLWFCRQNEVGLVFPFSMAVLGDPEGFPITVDHPRRPMNWYGRTKLISEGAIGPFSEDAFPAISLMKSNLYGEHLIDGKRVSKGTVINFFVDRARCGKKLTVYKPGSQSRNYVHVKDVASVYIRATEHLLESLEQRQTGSTSYEIASSEDLSVLTVAEKVSEGAREILDKDVPVELVENPRDNETLVDQFQVDNSRATNELGWEPEHTVEDSIRSLLRRDI